jgi:hypothetical protein
MKMWLTKFRISNALDDANAARKQVLPRGSQSEDVSQFEETARLLDRRLKSAQPAQTVPDGLHDSVLRAVRGAARAQERQFTGTILHRLPAPALALLIVGGVWWMLNRSEPESQSLATAGAALERSHQLTQQAPAAVLAPLSQEMESLNRDFRNAVEFLVASVP